MSRYTPPKIYRGKIPTVIPKGSSKAKELAKNIWYVNYSFDGKQIRVKDGLNRIKNASDKEFDAQILLQSIINDLKNGFNPNDEGKWIEDRIKENCSLAKAILVFKKYHEDHNSRPKTIGTYMSKLNALNSFLPAILLSEITTKNLQNFIQSKIDDKTYTQASVKSAKRIFSTFFNVCVQNELIEKSPYQGFDKKIKSFKETPEKHAPFSDKDLTTIMAFLDENDKYCAFFCRIIYFTCLRPSEIRGLKLENIDLTKQTITIPPSVKKVTITNEKEVIEINQSFRIYVEQLKISDYPSQYYLTGSSSNIIGENKVGENTPYNKLISALKKLGLNNKGYDLYSFKHTSNIKKYRDGWTLSEIMKANRHTSISTTEIYLRKLGQFVDTSAKKIPVI